MTTIRSQLTRRLLLGLALLIVCAGIAVYLLARAALVSHFDSALGAKAQALTTLTEQKHGRLEIDFAEENMRGFDKGGSDCFELWDGNGKPIETSPSLSGAQLPLRYGSQESPLAWNLLLSNQKPGRAIGFKFRPPLSDDRPADPTLAEGILVVASDRGDLDRALAVLGAVLGITGLLLLAATAVIVPQVLRRGLSPLDRLAQQASRIDAGSLSQRLAQDGLPGELAPITARFNELLQRLEEAFDRERRFSSDVAHEFRTPVAELRSMAELSLKIPEARPENFEREILHIALHLETILQQLLSLARGEAAQLCVRREPVDLGPLAREVCESFQSRAHARRLSLRCTVDGGKLDADPVLLRSILRNLIDNAVEYSPEGGSVDVEAGSGVSGSWLQVSNTVAGFESADLSRMFDRFWRKDAARSANGHTGLGLSLARVFAHLLQCELSASLVGSSRLALTLTPASMTIREAHVRAGIKEGADLSPSRP